MKDQSGIHGDTRRAEAAGSAAQFGWVFAAVFFLVGIFPLLQGGSARGWLLAIAAIFAGVTLWRPELLQPLNRLWHKFGLLLHHVVSPLVMGIIFYGVLMPVGLIMRARGTKFLALEFDPKAKSYWVRRQPPGPAPNTFEDQF